MTLCYQGLPTQYIIQPGSSPELAETDPNEHARDVFGL